MRLIWKGFRAWGGGIWLVQNTRPCSHPLIKSQTCRKSVFLIFTIVSASDNYITSSMPETESVQISKGGRTVVGRGLSPSILERLRSNTIFEN